MTMLMKMAVKSTKWWMLKTRQLFITPGFQHVIYFCFRDALAKLSQGHKLKCPYCPVEQNPADARQIFF